MGSPPRPLAEFHPAPTRPPLAYSSAMQRLTVSAAWLTHSQQLVLIQNGTTPDGRPYYQSSNHLASGQTVWLYYDASCSKEVVGAWVLSDDRPQLKAALASGTITHNYDRTALCPALAFHSPNATVGHDPSTGEETPPQGVRWWSVNSSLSIEVHDGAWGSVWMSLVDTSPGALPPPYGRCVDDNSAFYILGAYVTDKYTCAENIAVAAEDARTSGKDICHMSLWGMGHVFLPDPALLPPPPYTTPDMQMASVCSATCGHWGVGPCALPQTTPLPPPPPPNPYIASCDEHLHLWPGLDQDIDPSGGLCSVVMLSFLGRFDEQDPRNYCKDYVAVRTLEDMATSVKLIWGLSWEPPPIARNVTQLDACARFCGLFGVGRCAAHIGRWTEEEQASHRAILQGRALPSPPPLPPLQTPLPSALPPAPPPAPRLSPRRPPAVRSAPAGPPLGPASPAMASVGNDAALSGGGKGRGDGVGGVVGGALGAACLLAALLLGMAILVRRRRWRHRCDSRRAAKDSFAAISTSSTAHPVVAGGTGGAQVGIECTGAADQPLTAPQVAKHAVSAGRGVGGRGGASVGMRMRDLEFGELIGEGGNGLVFYGALQGTPVAIKVSKATASAHALALPPLDQQPMEHARQRELQQLQQMLSEANHLEALRHPHVTAYYRAGLLTAMPPALVPRCAAWARGHPLGIVLELMSGGALSEYLELQRPPSYQQPRPTAEVVRLCMEAASGLAYIHECGLIHRDIKASNVLLTTVDGVRHAKVCDLGGATAHAGTTACAPDEESDELPDEASDFLHTAGVGTLRYMSPEGTSRRYDQRSDVFSFGLLLWEAVHRQMIFASLSHREAARAIRQGTRPPVHQTARPLSPAPGWEDGPARDLMVGLMVDCWAADPRERPSMEAVVSRLRDASSTASRMHILQLPSINAPLLADADAAYWSAKVKEMDPALHAEAAADDWTAKDNGSYFEAAADDRTAKDRGSYSYVQMTDLSQPSPQATPGADGPPVGMAPEPAPFSTEHHRDGP